MSRTHAGFSIEVIAAIGQHGGPMPVEDIFDQFGSTKGRKAIYDCIFRLVSQELVEYANAAQTQVALTADGAALLSTKRPQRDGVWKLVIFDIPERQRSVRTFLRNRLKSLGFKKWQASIWVSPYKLDPSLEAELLQLAKKLFVRVIKTTDVNYTKDLEELFPLER
jgi:CRISPR-associated endonuclease Cas2